MSEEKVGEVTHYFDKPQVGAIELTGELKVGDRIAFRGHTTDFEQEIESMELDHESVETAVAGEEIAVKVADRVREGDEVYRVG
ncbi:MAG: translation elongation factor-like protein [Gemmatimonadota bacterium]